MSTRTKRSARFFALAACTAVSMASAPAAFADAPPDLPSEYSDVVEFWEQHDVAADVQATLLEKLAAGGELDSETPGEEPTNSTTTVEGVLQETTNTFEDGSVSVEWLQVGPGKVDLEAIMPGYEALVTPSVAGSIGSCKVTSGSGFTSRTNCLVGGSGGKTFSMYFYADYTIVQGARNDYISGTRNPGRSYSGAITGGGGLPVRSNYVSKETSAGPAGATYTGTYDTEIGGGTAYLSLTVGGNAASADFLMV